jgi:hypothetical protein
VKPGFVQHPGTSESPRPPGLSLTRRATPGVRGPAPDHPPTPADGAAGLVITHLARVGDQPNVARRDRLWAGLTVRTLWTVAALAVGLVVLLRRDA